MIENIDEKKIKDYESIEEAQKIKNSLEIETELDTEPQKEKPKKEEPNILKIIIFIIFTFVFIGCIVYHIVIKFKEYKNENQQDPKNEFLHLDQLTQNNAINSQTTQNNDTNNPPLNFQVGENNSINQTAQNVQTGESNNNLNQTAQNVQTGESNNNLNQTAQNVQTGENNNNLNQTAQNSQQTQNNETNQNAQNVQTATQANQTVQDLKGILANGTNKTIHHHKNASLTHSKSKSKSKSTNKKSNKPKIPFYDFLPKCKKPIKNIKDIFNSNRLYLNDKELTLEYIKYIKPLDKKKEKAFNKVLFPNITFDKYKENHNYNYASLLPKHKSQKHNAPSKSKQKKISKRTNVTNNINNNSLIFSNNLTNVSIDQNQLNNIILNTTAGISANSSMANNINSNNLSLTSNNTISNSNNLTLANNNSTNISQSLRNMKELDSNILKDFYALCDQKKLDTVKKNKKQSSDIPLISIIIPFYNNKLNLIKTLRSLQLQTLKNIEIIIVDDNDAKVNTEYKNLLDSDYRLRLFSQPKNMGLWRKRIDGFLYSRGKYILHINPGDILADSYVLEDLYHLVSKYNLDTVRFSFSKTKYDRSTLKENIKFNEKKIYPSTFTKIIYGRPKYNIHIFEYGTIWNRLVRAGVMRKGLDLLDKELLNVHKDLWEDMWWNDLIDRVSFSNLVVNRLGYIFLYDKRYSIEPRIGNKFLKNKSIKEFILFWYWDYCLLPKKNNKKSIVHTLRKYIKRDNKFSQINMSLEFLTDRYRPYENLLKRLINDPFVEARDKKFVSHLYNTTKAKYSKGSKKT